MCLIYCLYVFWKGYDDFYTRGQRGLPISYLLRREFKITIKVYILKHKKIFYFKLNVYVKETLSGTMTCVVSSLMDLFTSKT